MSAFQPSVWTMDLLVYAMVANFHLISFNFHMHIRMLMQFSKPYVMNLLSTEIYADNKLRTFTQYFQSNGVCDHTIQVNLPLQKHIFQEYM